MIRQATFWQAKAGRASDLTTLFRQAKVICERHGAVVSAFVNYTGDHAVLRYSFLQDFPSFAQAGAMQVARTADPAWQAFWARATGGDAPANPAGNTLVVFLDPDNPPPPGQWDPLISTLRQFRVDPGRQEEALILLKEMRERSLAMGAGYIRIGRLGYGANTGGLTMAIEHADWTSWGATNDALGPEMREWMRTHLGPEAPAKMIDNTIRLKVPLT